MFELNRVVYKGRGFWKTLYVVVHKMPYFLLMYYEISLYMIKWLVEKLYKMYYFFISLEYDFMIKDTILILTILLDSIVIRHTTG